MLSKKVILKKKETEPTTATKMVHEHITFNRLIVNNDANAYDMEIYPLAGVMWSSTGGRTGISLQLQRPSTSAAREFQSLEEDTLQSFHQVILLEESVQFR